MDLDTILTEVGEFGRYQQLMLWFVLLPGVFPCGFHAYNQIFMAAKPIHWCKVPELQYLLPEQEELFKNLSIPMEIHDGHRRFNQCMMRNLNFSEISINNYNQSVIDKAELIPCKYGWNYDNSQYTSTATIEWDLVCNKDLFGTIALVLFGTAGVIGNLIFGYIQDGLGRKPAFFIFLFIQCIFGIVTIFAKDFITWTILRSCVGLTIPAILGTPYVLSIELVGPKYRTIVSILTNISYSMALVTLAVIVWLIRDWRTLSLATTIPFLLLFVYLCILPESPRWLLSQGKFKEAETILLKIAKINKKTLSENFSNELKLKIRLEKTKTKDSHKYGIRDLFRNKNLCWKTIIITFIWFTNTSVYVGLSYYAPALGGNEFLNFFLAGIVELPTYLFLWPSMHYWGRRWTLCISMLIGGTACLATFLVQNDSVVTLGLYCVGKMGISSSFVVLPLMASELYPTVVRGLGISISSVVANLGPIIIPLINYLGTKFLSLPMMIMGALLLLGAACSLVLPETLNRHLPQTLEDSELVGLEFPTYWKSGKGETK